MNKSIWISNFDIRILIFFKKISYTTYDNVQHWIHKPRFLLTLPDRRELCTFDVLFPLAFAKSRINYRQTSNICSTLVGYELVHH